jgi:hypothetical protein
MKRGKPFEIGNKLGKGRPPGSLNKLTNEARKLLDDHGVPLIRTCIAAGLKGNMKAMMMCLDRLVPLRRQATPNLNLPSTKTIEGVALAYRALGRKIATGKCPAAEAQVIADVLKAQLDLILLNGLEQRLRELEKFQQKKAA